MREHRKLWEQTWRLSEQDRKAKELAKRYHDEAEAYDRTICTGPILNGSIQPANAHEFALINSNAYKLRRQILEEAEAAGISKDTMRRAIVRYGLYA